MTQIEYIDILFIDLGYTQGQKRDWLQTRYGRRYTDELTAGERSRVIETLKADKTPRIEPGDEE
jgi:hypothetical protein